jgi:uncharacterized protein YigA (DUF484 family)
MIHRAGMLFSAVLFGCAPPAQPASSVPIPSATASTTVSSIEPPTPAAAASAHHPAFDESQPEYWIAKLGDEKWRVRAIKRLEIFFEDLVTKTNRDFAHPELRAFIDKVLPPLSRTYLEHYATLDEKTREQVVMTLAAFRDPRVAPVLEKVFAEYAGTGTGAKELRWACRGVRDLKLRSVSASLFRAFQRLRPSTPEGAYYREVNEALLAVADPAWSPTLITMVETDLPVVDPRKKPSQEQVAAFKDQFYRSMTAAQLLGELREAKATRSLMRLVLDPSREIVADEAVLSLIKIGKPAAEAAASLLNGSDPELAAYQKERARRHGSARKGPGVSREPFGAAEILGAIGRREGIAPILAALGASKRANEKARLLRALAMLPHTPEVAAAFKNGFERLSTKAAYGGENAAVALSESAASFFDSSVTDLLVRKARALKHDKLAMSRVAFVAMETMNESQLATVEDLVEQMLRETEDSALKEDLEELRREFEKAAAVVRRCGDNAACYLEVARDSGNQVQRRALAALNALHRVGELSKPDATDRVIESFTFLEAGHLRYVATQVLDHHHPNGSLAVADALQVIVDRNLASMDREKAANDQPLRHLIPRLQTRAAP